MSELGKRIFWSFVGLSFTIPLGYIGKVALAQWGILDPFAKQLGGWLKLNVSPEQAEWTIAASVALTVYCVFLWGTWRHFSRPSWKEGQREAPGHRSGDGDATRFELPTPVSPPIPDMIIHDLFFHIRPDLLENAEER